MLAVFSVAHISCSVYRKQRRPPNLQAKAEKANEKHGDIAAEVVPAIDTSGVAESKATTSGGDKKKKTPKAQSPAVAAAKSPKQQQQQQPEEKKKKCIIS